MSEKKQTAVDFLIAIINHSKKYRTIIEQRDIDNAVQMQDEQMQLTWNNAIDAVQKDKWESYDEFYNNIFKSE